MIRKYVSETAHDEYVQHTNDLLRKDNPLITDDVVKRGEDLEFISKRSWNRQLIIGGDNVTLLNAHVCAV